MNAKNRYTNTKNKVFVCAAETRRGGGRDYSALTGKANSGLKSFIPEAAGLFFTACVLFCVHFTFRIIV